MRNFREGVGMTEKLYKVPFTGYCEVWANSAEEAVKQADDDKMFFVKFNFEDPVCLDEEDTDELD
jgi:hypothetical protein